MPFNHAQASDDNFLHYYTIEAKSGDGVIKLLKRFHLWGENCNERLFYDINGLKRGQHLLIGKSYAMPIKMYKYNAKSIRSTIHMDDWDLAKEIAEYNRLMRDTKIKPTYYLDDHILMIPLNLLNCPSDGVVKEPEKAKKIIESAKKEFVYSTLFGTDNRVEKLSSKLKDKVYYIMSGHGGPDPGAINHNHSTKLCEDEYAYDVSLRLMRTLMQYGAEVHMIIQDKNDGIRNDAYLKSDHDEICLNEGAIPLNQLERLKQRVRATNNIYHKSDKKKDHTVISIHVDSRPSKSRQDVFFYYCPKSEEGKTKALKIQKVFKAKYKQHRANGAYHGTVSPKGLYVLRKTDPTAVFVELANIQNNRDLKRIMQWDNRQILAEWLFEGLTGIAPKKMYPE